MTIDIEVYEPDMLREMNAAIKYVAVNSTETWKRRFAFLPTFLHDTERYVWLVSYETRKMYNPLKRKRTIFRRTY